MQIMTNSYFGLQNYSNHFKIQDSQTTSRDTIESQNTQPVGDEEASQVTDVIAPESPTGEKLDESEQQYVRELAAIDANVRAHEAAHVGAGAGVVSGGASFGYTRGPDGKMYATSGEVPISMKEGRTPEETIQNARQIISAAMAPSDPSPQDYKVAANAAQMEVQARNEQAKERAEEIEERAKDSNETENSKELNSNSQRTDDSTNQNSTPKESQNISSEQEEKPFFENELIAYAMKSYIASATSNSYIPRLDIAG
ncbi:putative metalloprotease CJM1_0395 family protein [uncultured Helicobacter sp.]|uniref:putative metalloprotease CJM1_0395 family protein n=1 Tax=uncultured Helicobacter sp. TaxID=175537 RepID=UPI002619E8D0|nr:putative metalloprotease CJM1_0395 family protein [uncultured Helicobacter sp.]